MKLLLGFLLGDGIDGLFSRLFIISPPLAFAHPNMGPWAPWVRTSLYPQTLKSPMDIEDWAAFSLPTFPEVPSRILGVLEVVA